MALSAEVGEDLEQVEGVQRKFDDFQKVNKHFVSTIGKPRVAYCSNN